MKELKYSKAPSVIFRLPIGSQQQRMLLFILASMEGTNTKPTQGLLAYSIGTHTSTVSNLLNALAADGWIDIIKPKNRFKGDICEYHINWNKIKGYTSEKDYFKTSSEYEEKEAKTPFIPIEEEFRAEEQIPTGTEQIDTNDNEQINKDMKLYDFPTGINSDEFYTAFVAGSIKYWIHLYNQEKKDELKQEIDKWAIYAANRFYDGAHAKECRNKIYDYLKQELNIAS